MPKPMKDSEKFLLRVACLPQEEAIRLWTEKKKEFTLTSSHLRYLPTIYLRFQSWDYTDELTPKLHRAYISMWSRNQQYIHHTQTLLDALTESDIPVLLLKSSALIRGYACNPGFRYLTDIDFAIPNSQIAKGINIAKSLGFMDAHSLSEQGSFRSRHSYDGIDSDNYRIDMHWRVHQFASHELSNAFWSRSTRTSGTFSIPSISDLFYLILYHGGKSMIFDGYWTIDATTVLATHGEALDWDLLLWNLNKEIYKHPLCKALHYLHSELNVDIPESFLEKTAAEKPGMKERFYLYVNKDFQTRPQWLIEINRTYVSSEYLHDRSFFIGLIKALCDRRSIRSIRDLIQYLYRRCLHRKCLKEN